MNSGFNISDRMLCVKKNHVNSKKNKTHFLHTEMVHRHTLAHSEKTLERSFAQKKNPYICYN